MRAVGAGYVSEKLLYLSIVLHCTSYFIRCSYCGLGTVCLGEICNIMYDVRNIMCYVCNSMCDVCNIMYNVCNIICDVCNIML